MTGFPWAEAMRLAFGVMRLGPRDFWALTPRELAAMATALSGVSPAAPDRAALEHLMHLYPDEKPNG